LIFIRCRWRVPCCLGIGSSAPLCWGRRWASCPWKTSDQVHLSPMPQGASLALPDCHSSRQFTLLGLCSRPRRRCLCCFVFPPKVAGAKRKQKKLRRKGKKNKPQTCHVHQRAQRIRPEKMEGRRLRSWRTFLTFVLLFCALSPFVVRADEENNEYKDGEVIPFLVNTIGPYANPSEIYGYYSLPVCAPPKEQRSPDRTFNLGESLEGDEFKKSLYVLKFKGSLNCVS